MSFEDAFPERARLPGSIARERWRGARAAARRGLLGVAQHPWLITAAAAIAFALLAPRTGDEAAAYFRVHLFQREGFALWDAQWYGGHNLPGYSMLFPPLGAALGERLVGVLSTIAAALLFERLLPERYGTGARVGAMAFGAGAVANLAAGRVTFALGVAVGLAALVALRRGHPLFAAGLAAATALASPVAGAFLALAAVAAFAVYRRRDAAGVAAGALAPIVLFAGLFPEVGSQPFDFSDLLVVGALAAAGLFLLPRTERTLGVGVLLYAGAAAAAFAIPTPLGGNVTRLGELFGLPLLVCVLWRDRRAALAVLAVPLLAWQWAPGTDAVAVASGDPSLHRDYYAQLVRFLDDAADRRGPMRIEIPLTRNHWETVWVARRLELARGWERQLDVRYNGLFYTSSLTADRYHAWLLDNAVSYVALPDVPLDDAALAEARIIRSRPAFLRPVWHSRDWRVFAVTGARPLLQGPGRLVSVAPQGFVLNAARAGDFTVRLRYTPYWSVADKAGCALPASDGWTHVRAFRSGPITVGVQFRLALIDASSGQCQPSNGPAN
ncbi:MAG TPA: hypothetical protein VGN78_05850 [Solirubrobacteraceae bacterium]|jgi:hypothetical protein|nr:hypothetical protein [Solirubrobacteraceae bacterium]